MMRRVEENPISIAPDNAPAAKTGLTREVSPAAQACTAWFRRLTRALKVSRLYSKSENAMVIQNRDQVLEALQRHLKEAEGWTLHFTPTEAYLGDEPVIQPRVRGKNDETPSQGEEQLPFVFYSDGIRTIHIPADVDREELLVFFDALRVVGGGRGSHDDLVTLLWQANLRQIQVDSVPLELSIYVSARQSLGSSGVLVNEKRYGLSPTGEEIRTELGQEAGTQGLHLDTFDDWELAESSVGVEETYQALLPTMEYSLTHFREAWEEERDRDWTIEAALVFHEMLRLDPDDANRKAIAHAIVTWIGESLSKLSLAEAQRAVELLSEFDPDRSLSEADLTQISAELDHDAFVEFLDQAEADEHGRFAALAVELGRPALDLVFGVMSKSTEERVRAAACTALTYLCADNPRLLAPYFSDAQGEVLVQLVFTLGQIGGIEVIDLLRLAAQHPESKVRRQVVLSLGSVPAPIRMPTLVAALDSSDPQLIAATLQILTRERNPHVAGAILKRVTRSDFDSLTEDTQWALFNALGDTAGDECVTGLEEILMKGGLFARRSFSRSASARALQRMGTERARRVLARGLKVLSPVIRNACVDVTKEGM
jgi:HEAT repeat protein